MYVAELVITAMVDAGGRSAVYRGRHNPRLSSSPTYILQALNYLMDLVHVVFENSRQFLEWNEVRFLLAIGLYLYVRHRPSKPIVHTSELIEYSNSLTDKQLLKNSQHTFQRNELKVSSVEETEKSLLTICAA